MSMASYRGAATLSAISIPPTGTHPRDYHAPLQDYLINYEVDTGTQDQAVRPHHRHEIADMVRPQFGDDVPTDEEAISKTFGYGWWKQDIAQRKSCCARRLHQERQPVDDAQRRALRVLGDGAARRRDQPSGRSLPRPGRRTACRRRLKWEPGNAWDRQAAGDYEVNIAWAVETWGGHPDLSFFLDSYHSSYVAEPGAPAGP